MYKTLLSIAVFFVSEILSAQEVVLTPEDSEFYKYKTKEEVFYDDFNDDKNKWIGKDYNPSVSIENGMFRVSDTSSWGITVLWDYSKDFEIEFRAKLIGNTPYSAGSFDWGLECGVSNATISFFKSHLNIYGTCDGVEVKTRHRYKRMKEQEFYTYSIRKIGTNYFYFVNDKYCGKHPFWTLVGRRISVGTNEAVTYFDYLKISYLK